MSFPRTVGLATLLLGIVLVGAELLCRRIIGLGDPPLIIRDPKIDYLFAPSHSYARLGNTITFNSFSMRADDISENKKDPNEFRVLVIGDSVVYGGVLTDDRNLATRILQDRLRDRLKRPVWVGNVSAASWGPGNQLAYLRKFGSFHADIAIVVLSSHDYEDVTGFLPDLGPDFTERSPILALEEVLFRYLPRYVPWIAPVTEQVSSEVTAAVRAQGARELSELLDELKRQVPYVVAMHHEERDEPTQTPRDDALALHRTVEQAGVEFIELRPYLVRAAGDGNPYRDQIHLNDLGQRQYAEAFACVTLTYLKRVADECP